MKKVILLLIVLLGGMYPWQSKAIDVVPYPNWVQSLKGTCSISERLTVSFPQELDAAYAVYALLFKESGINLIKEKDGLLSFKKVSGLGKEAYQISVSPQEIVVSYTCSAGAFYAVQTLKQLIQREGTVAYLPCIEIKDEPAFPHRAFMLDEGREFKGKVEVKKLLDEMARLKLNIFHWHLCEDRGWRIQIDKYPKLTEIGSKMRFSEPYGMTVEKWDKKYQDPWFYTKKEIAEIVAYAAARQIQVIPEIEIPGHSGASIKAYPWLGCASSKTGEHVRGDIYNVIDPRVEQFIQDVIEELMPLFPMKILHIGGDEAEYWSWEKDPKVVKFIADQNLKNPAGLQVWFINRINKYLNNQGWSLMGWNEITGDDLRGEHEAAQVSLDTTAIVHFWDGSIDLLGKSVRRGYRVVNSDRLYTYLDYSMKVTPIEKCYRFTVVPEGISPTEASKIMGFGAQMWGEQSPTPLAMYKLLYPRIAALAECGWTQPGNKDFIRFTKSIPSLERIWTEKGYYLPQKNNL